MADNVKAFPGVSAPDQELGLQPVEQVVEYLADMLAKAKAGKIRAIAFAYVKPCGNPSHGWAGIRSGGATMYALHSGLMIACTSFAVELDADSTDSPSEPIDDNTEV